MTILEETVVVISDPRPEPPPMFHRLCCLDHSKTICGIKRKSQEAVEMADDQLHTDCIVCDDLWETSVHCPIPNNTCYNPNRMGGTNLPFDLI